MRHCAGLAGWQAAVGSRFCCSWKRVAGGRCGPGPAPNGVSASRSRLSRPRPASVCARPPPCPFVSDAVLWRFWQLLSCSCDVFVSELWCIPMKMWSDFQVSAQFRTAYGPCGLPGFTDKFDLCFSNLNLNLIFSASILFGCERTVGNSKSCQRSMVLHSNISLKCCLLQCTLFQNFERFWVY